MLSKQTQDQIRKEAGEYNSIFVETAYIAGAETWAVWKEKAEGYEEALKEIKKSDSFGTHDLIERMKKIATKALEQFKIKAI